VYEEIGDERPIPETVIDAMCGLNEIDYNLISQVEMLGPFGNMNPEPVLCAKKYKNLIPHNGRKQSSENARKRR